MRPTCIACALKHVAQAEVLMQEAALGYPLHAHLAVGHLAEAEAELVKDHPEMADAIRGMRSQYEAAGTVIHTMAILESLLKLET